MTVEMWITFIRRMSFKGLRSLHITGGEPFTSSTTVPLLREAQAVGLSTSILSNGLRIPMVAEREPAILRKLSVAQISLDSLDAKVHDRRRGKRGALDQAFKAIEALRKLTVPVEISCTLDDENAVHVDGIAAYARSIGASLILRPVVYLGRASHYPLSHADRTFSLHSDILVSDRFLYVPSGPQSDGRALEAGILTVLPDGRFRSGPIVCAGFLAAVSSAPEMLEAA
jgi:MoaA/NifB/PqqE/SkfB family radical SAM enzyme